MKLNPRHRDDVSMAHALEVPGDRMKHMEVEKIKKNWLHKWYAEDVFLSKQR